MLSRNKKCFWRYFAMVCFLLVVVPTWAQDPAVGQPAKGDNSKVNQQDRNPAEPTADQQKNNSSDLKMAREIRRALTEDKSLSTYAHNVKVIAQDGKVTLKGPVRSDDEKAAVLAKAGQVVGQANINDEITVVPKHD